MKTNTLLLGPSGTGKTYSIRTLLDAGLEVFVIATEPGIESVLGDTDPTRLHWHYVKPQASTWDTLMAIGERINRLSFETLAKSVDPNRSAYTQWLEVLNQCANFIDDRTGEEFGDVTLWDESRALVVDSLTGLNVMAMDLVVGSRPVKGMQDWQIAQNNLEKFLQTLVTATRCHFVLTGHIEREVDEVLGGVKLMASTLGRKLAPKIPVFFDDVVLAEREGDKFFWSTSAAGADLKARNLPISAKLPPTFTQIAHAPAKKEKN